MGTLILLVVLILILPIKWGIFLIASVPAAYVYMAWVAKKEVEILARQKAWEEKQKKEE